MTIDVVDVDDLPEGSLPVAEVIRRAIIALGLDPIDATAATAVALAQLTIDAGASPILVIRNYAESVNLLFEAEERKVKG